MLQDTPEALLALITAAQDALAAACVPAAASAMAHYMRDLQPFYGVSRPLRAPIERELVTRFKPADLAAYKAGVQALWSGPMREERYLALAYARLSPGYPTLDALDLYLLLIRDGAWWDLVDEIAGRILSPLYLAHRDALYDEVEAWICDESPWVRRAALLAHLKHGAATDSEQLFRHCLTLADETDPFIRKAIGWALRTYAHHEPARVRAFLSAHRASLSKLSLREASKHL